MATYTNPTIDQEITPKQLFYPDNKCAIFTCNGNPQGVIIANTGSIALSDNGSIYKKTTDDIATGWVELQSGASASPFTIVNGGNNASFAVSASGLVITVDGGTPLTLRSNGQILGVKRRINLDVSTVGNVGVGLDALHNFSLPANSLAANNDEVEFECGGSLANNANTKRITFSFDGQITLDTGLRSITSAGANIGWKMLGSVIRLTATTVRVNVSIIDGFCGVDSANTPNGFGAGGVIQTKTFDLTVANLTSNAVNMLVSAEGTANNDIVQNLSKQWLTQV
ncbi:MAG TPA: hypothetical protein VH815_03060 [Acidobacteriota bacterium]|jgi:hypothetical protein